MSFSASHTVSNGKVTLEQVDAELEDETQESMAGSSNEEESSGTEEEIAAARASIKSSKTQKRKRRATSPSRFGSALQSLLQTTAPSETPLSLKPSFAKQQHREKLEVKAKKLLEGEKREKEETNHIADVIGGWGGESERSLRKTAQRGGMSSIRVDCQIHFHLCQSSNCSMQSS